MIRSIRDNVGIDRASSILKISRRCIFSVRELDQYMNRAHREWFQQQQAPDECLLLWLGVQRNAKKEEPREREAKYSTNDFRKLFSTNENANDDEDDEFAGKKPPKPVLSCTPQEVINPHILQRNLECTDTMSDERENQLVRRSQHVRPDDRWPLYRLWLQRLERDNLQRIQDAQPEYEQALMKRQEVVRQEEYGILSNARVVGMTTTCAARYRDILKRLRPKIILVEEAAEVLEAHVITSLTSSCEHLILIGDHQQLRPSTNVYKLAKDFKLDISLFERMVHNGIPCERLSVQHRMRPEIASLMKHVYEDLHNHECVSNFEDIKGVKRNMFFIKHSHLEEQGDDTHSHSNTHEAMFLVALCRYLLQQGYKPSQITMLTPYTGQMFAIRDAATDYKEQWLLDVRVSTIDNFQGEENDIILLSLVRSNDDGKVGFINVSNRTCVALSRAKKGLYCIGNFDFLSQHSEIWSEIIRDLSETNSIGDTLPLVCQSHGDVEVEVSTAEDFQNKTPRGGCLRMCEARLQCGHACRLLCHPLESVHAEYRCVEPCAKPIQGCLEEHLCTKLCWEQCVEECEEMVEKELPQCGHTQTMKCRLDAKRMECKERCKKTLDCGHQCQSKCGQPCTSSCQERVKKSDWSCGHEVTVACSSTQKDCLVPCKTTLECGHKCPGTCGECRQGRVHKSCKFRCGRLLVCSHPCNQQCMASCPPCSKKCENRCVHSKCTKLCGELCIPCKEKCQWECPHFSCSKLCSDLCSRPRCNEPCGKTPPCGNVKHVCRGLCEEPCICVACDRNDCKDPITELFFGGEDEEDALFIRLPDCEHIFAVSDLDRYMDMQEEETHEGHNVSVQLKTCPRCKTPIRRSLRYGNIVKQQLRDIERVKSQLCENQENLKVKKSHLQIKIAEMKERNRDDKNCDLETLDRRLDKAKDAIAMSFVENQLTLMERYFTLKQHLNEAIFRKPRTEVEGQIRSECQSILSELDYMKKRATSIKVTQKEFRDIHVEFTRLSLCIELCKLRNEVKQLKLKIFRDHDDLLDKVEEEVSRGVYIEEEKLDQYLADLAAIRYCYNRRNSCGTIYGIAHYTVLIT